MRDGRLAIVLDAGEFALGIIVVEQPIFGGYPQVAAVVDIKQFHGSFHAELGKLLHSVLLPGADATREGEQFVHSDHPQRGVGCFPDGVNIVGTPTHLQGHIVAETVSIVSADTVDGGEPNVTITVAQDIPDKIVGQPIFDVEGVKGLRGLRRNTCADTAQKGNGSNCAAHV